MGLFVGMSILSVIEIIFWLILVCRKLSTEFHSGLVDLSRSGRINKEHKCGKSPMDEDLQ